MAIYSPVGSSTLLRDIQSKGLLPKHQLILAHDVLANPEDYRALAAEMDRQAGRGGPTYLIMDNSLIELGYPLDVNLMLDAMNIIYANAVVLPDALLDIKKTIEMSCSALDIYAFHRYDGEFVVVAQGSNLEEIVLGVNTIIARAQQLGYSKENFVISIPRIYTNQFGSRMEAINALVDFGYKRFHLLGFSSNFADDIECARSHTGILGIDSATPLRFGWEGGIINKTLYEVDYSKTCGPREEYFKQANVLSPCMAYNMGIIQGLLSGE